MALALARQVHWHWPGAGLHALQSGRARAAQRQRIRPRLAFCVRLVPCEYPVSTLCVPGEYPVSTL